MGLAARRGIHLLVTEELIALSLLGEANIVFEFQLVRGLLNVGGDGLRVADLAARHIVLVLVQVALAVHLFRDRRVKRAFAFDRDVEAPVTADSAAEAEFADIEGTGSTRSSCRQGCSCEGEEAEGVHVGEMVCGWYKVRSGSAVRELSGRSQSMRFRVEGFRS